MKQGIYLWEWVFKPMLFRLTTSGLIVWAERAFSAVFLAELVLLHPLRCLLLLQEKILPLSPFLRTYRGLFQAHPSCSQSQTRVLSQSYSPMQSSITELKYLNVVFFIMHGYVFISLWFLNFAGGFADDRGFHFWLSGGFLGQLGKSRGAATLWTRFHEGLLRCLICFWL